MHYIITLAFIFCVCVNQTLSNKSINLVINQLFDMNQYYSKKILFDCLSKKGLEDYEKNTNQSKDKNPEFDLFLEQLKGQLYKKEIIIDEVPKQLFSQLYNNPEYTNEMYECYLQFIRSLTHIKKTKSITNKIKKPSENRIVKAKTVLRDCYKNYKVCEETFIDENNLFTNEFMSVIDNSIELFISNSSSTDTEIITANEMTNSVINHLNISNDENGRLPLSTNYISLCSAVFYVKLFHIELPHIYHSCSELEKTSKCKCVIL